jgi:DNA-binding NarL/FixJ family response regulator
VSDQKIDVMIVHGNPLVAAGLKAAILPEADMQLVSVQANPGVAVTDYETGLRLMQTCGPDLRVLIVTDDNSEVSVCRAMEMGAQGYLPLYSPVESVARAVRCIHRGGTAIDPTAMTKIAVSLASPSLTGREIEVLRLLMQGLPNKAIAFRLKRTIGTARAHVKSILNKLDATSRTEAVAIARRRGLLPEEVSAPPRIAASLAAAISA